MLLRQRFVITVMRLLASCCLLRLMQPLLPPLHPRLGNLGREHRRRALAGAAHRALPVPRQVAVEHKLLHLFVCGSDVRPSNRAQPQQQPPHPYVPVGTASNSCSSLFSFRSTCARHETTRAALGRRRWHLLPRGAGAVPERPRSSFERHFGVRGASRSQTAAACCWQGRTGPCCVAYASG